MVNSGDRISPVQGLLILATYLLPFTGLAHAQMGIRFDECADKNEFQNIKEHKEFGEIFTTAEITEKTTGLKTIYTFYDSRLARVEFIRSDNVEWSEDLAQQLWKKLLTDDRIISRQDLFDKDKIADGFIIFNGENKNQMVLGRGRYKSSFILESAKMNDVYDRYKRGQVNKLEHKNTIQNTELLNKKQTEEISYLKKEVQRLSNVVNNMHSSNQANYKQTAYSKPSIGFARQDGPKVQVYDKHNSMLFHRTGTLVNYTSDSINIKEGTKTYIYDSIGSLKYSTK